MLMTRSEAFQRSVVLRTDVTLWHLTYVHISHSKLRGMCLTQTERLEEAPLRPCVCQTIFIRKYLSGLYVIVINGAKMKPWLASFRDSHALQHQGDRSCFHSLVPSSAGWIPGATWNERLRGRHSGPFRGCGLSENSYLLVRARAQTSAVCSAAHYTRACSCGKHFSLCLALHLSLPLSLLLLLFLYLRVKLSRFV